MTDEQNLSKNIYDANMMKFLYAFSTSLLLSRNIILHDQR